MLLLRHFYHFKLTGVIWRYFARNFMEEMRSAGQVTGGPAPFSQADRKEFANQLDRWLQRHHKP